MVPRGRSQGLYPCHLEAEMRPAAYDYPDGAGSGGGGSEGVNDEDVVISADERKPAMIGCGGVARRRSFVDEKRQRWSAVRAFCFLA